ncbi:MAG: response regulator transcription factor [Burkholderiales bacterium]|nr:response regulator transcription factor [Burkholderiales bacterium]
MSHTDFSKPTILLVDDDVALCTAVSEFLSQNGFATVVAYQGSSGLQKLDGQPVAAAIIDLHLPDMTGLELAEQLRGRLGEGLPIIVLSGDSSMDTLNSLAAAGATYYFNKPVNRHWLLQQLQSLLHPNAAAAKSQD